MDYGFLEHCLREDLNLNAQRTMAVLRPIKLILTNYPENKTETFEVENNPNRPEDGTRTVTFSRELYIEADDFMEEPVKGYFRLFPGNEVRLKTTYIVRCTGCKKDDDGNVVEVYAEYDPETRGGNTPDGRKIKGTIHWADAKTALDAEVRLYDNQMCIRDRRCTVLAPTRRKNLGKRPPSCGKSRPRRLPPRGRLRKRSRDSGKR